MKTIFGFISRFLNFLFLHNMAFQSRLRAGVLLVYEILRLSIEKFDHKVKKNFLKFRHE
jgi:hypothetical protein